MKIVLAFLLTAVLASASVAQSTTQPSELSDLRRIIAMLQSQIVQLKTENAASKRQLAMSPHVPLAATAAQGGELSAPTTGITEAALTKGWQATKIREGQATSLQGEPIVETIYTLPNGATVLVVDGKVDRFFLDPKIGMAADELLAFNQHREADGEKTSTKVISETASEIVYQGPGWDGRAWVATVDNDTHKVVAINH